MTDNHGIDSDFKALLVEAHDLGIQYTGVDPSELGAFVTMARAERGRTHEVPCYGLSYDPTDRRCRICQLRNPCADLDKRPRVVVLEAHLQSIPCGACGKGMLEIECVDKDTGHIRDFACTTKGCQNSVAVQCGWETQTDVVREVVLGEPEPEPADVAEVEDSPEAAAPSSPAEPAAPKKKILIVRSGSKASVPTPKVVRKSVVKSAKVMPVDISSSDRTFRIRGVDYPSLTALVNDVTGSRNWSPRKFFKVDPRSVKAGDRLLRTWKGVDYIVEVIG